MMGTRSFVFWLWHHWSETAFPLAQGSGCFPWQSVKHLVSMCEGPRTLPFYLWRPVRSYAKTVSYHRPSWQERFVCLFVCFSWIYHHSKQNQSYISKNEMWNSCGIPTETVTTAITDKFHVPFDPAHQPWLHEFTKRFWWPPSIILGTTATFTLLCRGLDLV